MAFFPAGRAWRYQSLLRQDSVDRRCYWGMMKAKPAGWLGVEAVACGEGR